MTVQREFEIGLQFWDTYWGFCKFVVNEISKDAYLVFLIPEVGLKLSLHSPKPPIFPDRHAHLRSHKLGIHEDIDASFFSPECWKEDVMEFWESLKCCQPSSDEDVIALRTDFLPEALTTKI